MGPLLAEDPRRIGGYRIVGRLGAGGMGTVYLGRSAAGTPVAIKVIHPERSGDPGFRARFAREVTAARAVSGAFTAPVVDADPGAADPWLATAYLPGMSLQDAVAEHGPLPVQAVFGLGAGLAEALVSVHRAGVVHRDLKPANVMLAPDGPRLIDFGIAHAAGAAVVTRAGSLVGSPGYLPPEQATGGATGPAGDVFALGCVLAFAATGTGPFGRGAAEVLIYRAVHDAPRLDAVPDPELRDLIALCLDKDPARRPPPHRLVSRFAARAPDADVLHGTAWLPEPVAERIVRAERALPGRRRFLAAGLAAGGVAALAGTGTAVALLRGEEGEPETAPSVTPSPAAASTPAAPPPQARQLWKRDIGFDPYGGLAAGDRLLYVSADQGRLFALDPRTGRERWRYRTGDRGEGAASWRTPVPAGGVLYAGWPDANGPLFAFDADSGRVRWRSPVAADARDPAVGGGLVVACSKDCHALDARTGAERWRRSLGNVLGAVPVIAGPAVFVNSLDALHALDLRSGRTRWRRAMEQQPTGGEGARGPVVAGGLVLCSNGVGDLLALDAATGRERWRFVGGTGVGTAHVSGGAAFVADGSGTMVALDAATGRVRWRYPTGGDDVGRGSVSDGVLCFTAGDSALGLDAATGRPLWRTTVGGDVRDDVAAHGRYHLAYEDGTIVAYAVKGR
ncbi:PQQ-binding-like beta-propeller repeat protein [Spirillospora albida]|uniref:serine/threonine-protein kinase n=1 Tax=Spirillospora albida TaxID=58123 RepID=UPI000689E1EC|nr:serine/threonine-protein kinase [Spirillospora albida]